MNSRVSWSVDGIDPSVRDRAEAAARRAGMSLYRAPRQPTAGELLNVGRKFPPNHLHDSWLDFLYWDAELDA